MSVRKLEYKVKVLESVNFVSKYHEAINNFFTSLNTMDFSFSFEIANFKTSFNEFDNDELQETTVMITCTDIKDPDFVKLASHIHKMWCKKAQENVYIQWLILTCCYVNSPNFIPYGNFRVNEIGFGTLPRMKDFIQSYRFREVKVSSRILSSVLCTFNHLKKEITLYISISHKQECEAVGEMGYKITFAYESIIRVIANIGSDLTASELFIHLEYPPFITTGKSDQTEEASEEGPFPLNRVTKAKEMEYSSKKFERTFNIGCSCNKTAYNSRLIGRNLVLKLVIEDKFQFRYNLEQMSLRCAKKTEICFTHVKTHFLKNDDKVKLKKLPHYISNSKCLSKLDQFSCEYAWNVVQCRSDFIVHQISLKNMEIHDYVKSVLNDIFSLIKSNLSAFVRALYSIADMIVKGVIFDFLSVLKKKHLYFCHNVEAIELPKGMVYVRRVLITPSRTIFLQPYEHLDNRIIRKFGTEYMMRASIQDDNYSKLTFAVQYNSNREEIMKNVVGNVLLSGISIGSRTYEPLAASTSQLRDHGIWMYAKDNNLNTADNIRQWMGNFSSIRNVAKFMARMGQCFSSTETGVQVFVENKNEVDLKEIKTHDKRYTFSDGIGIISSELAEEVRHALLQNIKASHLSVTETSDYKPVAFQIRYKGCKGMVVEYEGSKLGILKLSGRKLGVRPSMNKFECTTSNQLEIVKTSSPSKLFLNKHLITILEQLGVPKEVFLNLELDMILHLLDSLIDEKVASSILTQNLSPVFPFHNLENAGICLTTDPFFRSLLLAYFKSYAENLTSKMRIAVPHEYGRNMLGVLDETKTLKYGQVFIQYSKSLTDPTAGTEVFTGPVIVTKNPSLHPGDLRKLTAVDVPALHHIKDCIVFPARGSRPHPDEMAGSDLDGDEMVVCWYKPLIFSRKNVNPMIYPVYKEEQSETDIQVSDMIKFFCHYIQNDNIGTFAHAHLVWADKLEEGVFSKKCMTIAKNYPYVLDFAKYGTTKYLKKSDRPSQYPDFMQKGLRGNTYHSHKVLGILYRTARVLEACSSKISLACETLSHDPDLEYCGWKLYEESAEKHRKDYTAKVLQILDRYSLRNEAEAFSGCIELDSVKEWRQEKDNAIKVVKKYFSNLIGIYRNLFLQEVEEECRKNNLCKEEKLEGKYQRASAWYMVVYGKKTEGVLSFAWVLSDILLEIKRNSMKNKYLSSSNLSSFLNDLDCDIKLWCDANIISCDSEEKCQCNHLLEKISSEWIFKSGLNTTKSEADTYCKICYERIFLFYKSKSDLSCCGGSNKELCSCKESCSPAKLLIHFLKFFITTVQPSLGSCEDESCDGFLPKNLQELSLQTYSYLAVTRNIFYVGLQFNTNNCTKNAILASNFEGVFEEEGDPIKIPVDSALKEIIENHLNEVKRHLKKKSGVTDITLKPVKEPMCLIVNSVGRNWQRWNLQEILLDVNFTANLKKNLSIPS